MARNIKDAETDRLARELAASTGESITAAIRTALDERLRRIRSRSGAHADGDELRELIRRGRARPVLDERPDDALLGYDESGLPE